MATLAEQIAELQSRANQEAQALVDAEKIRQAKENLTGGKLSDTELAKKFEDVQHAVNASAPHAVIAHLLALIKHLFAVTSEKLDAPPATPVNESDIHTGNIS